MIWGDTAIFINPTDPNNCILTNRFKRGERVGFRMTAIDGGTGEVEQTAGLIAHVTFAGKTVDVPMNWRGAAGPKAPAPRGYAVGADPGEGTGCAAIRRGRRAARLGGGGSDPNSSIAVFATWDVS